MKLLPDCSVVMKETRSEDDSNRMHLQHTHQVTSYNECIVWQLCDKAGCDRVNYRWQKLYTVARFASVHEQEARHSIVTFSTSSLANLGRAKRNSVVPSASRNPSQILQG